MQLHIKHLGVITIHVHVQTTNYSAAIMQSTHFALSVKAMSPEAIAVAAELPPKVLTQVPLRPAVTCNCLLLNERHNEHDKGSRFPASLHFFFFNHLEQL